MYKLWTEDITGSFWNRSQFDLSEKLSEEHEHPPVVVKLKDTNKVFGLLEHKHTNTKTIERLILIKMN